jgi:PAT family beta-lactamase induction signal transducer AmpG
MNTPISILKALRDPRLWIILFLGFSSGLPLALTASTLEGWFAVSDKTYTEIGFITLVGTPYVFKFLWAPLVDRYVWPFLGRRRGWMLVTQILLLIGIAAMSQCDPRSAPMVLAAIAVCVAFVSATQDIAVDAYRTELIPAQERGLSASFFVAAYRVALIVSSGLAFILADHIGWEYTYLIMAALMGVGIATTLLAMEPSHAVRNPTTLQDAFIHPLTEFLSRPAAVYLLLAVVFYKFGDAFIAKMFTSFYIKGLGFTLTEVGTISKMGGWVASIIGAMVGGWLMLRIRLITALMAFGLLQALSNLMFLWLAHMGHNFHALAATVIVENFCSGLGIAAFVALIMGLCHPKYTAAQYALLSALSAVAREFLGPVSGILVDQYGWATFFTMTFIFSFPGLYFVWKARQHMEWVPEQDDSYQNK